MHIKAFLILSISFSITLTNGADYNYWLNGYDWTGACATGKSQTPINIETSNVKIPDFSSYYPLEIKNMGVISKMKVFSAGINIEAEFEEFSQKPDIRVPVTKKMLGENNSDNYNESNLKYVTVTPIQFHAHTNSENTINGKYSAAEIHIVTKVDNGQTEACDKSSCFVNFGILLSYVDGIYASNDLIQFLLDNVPNEAGVKYGIEIEAELDLNEHLPSDKSYYAWDGSLTSEPCTEGALWILFEENLPISMDQVTYYQFLISTLPGSDCDKIVNNQCYPKRSKSNNRALQPLNDRHVTYVKLRDNLMVM